MLLIQQQYLTSERFENERSVSLVRICNSSSRWHNVPRAFNKVSVCFSNGLDFFPSSLFMRVYIYIYAYNGSCECFESAFSFFLFLNKILKNNSLLFNEDVYTYAFRIQDSNSFNQLSAKLFKLLFNRNMYHIENFFLIVRIIFRIFFFLQKDDSCWLASEASFIHETIVNEIIIVKRWSHCLKCHIFILSNVNL